MAKVGVILLTVLFGGCGFVTMTGTGICLVNASGPCLTKQSFESHHYVLCPGDTQTKLSDPHPSLCDAPEEEK